MRESNPQRETFSLAPYRTDSVFSPVPQPKGSIVDIETLSVKAEGYSGNSGRVVKYQKNGYIYMPGYGSGFLASRVCSQAESAVKVEGWYRAATNNLTAYLQYSTDGSSWLTLVSKTTKGQGSPFYFEEKL